jgi:acetylornithine deacetylase
MIGLSVRARNILDDLIAFPTISSDSNLAMIDYIRALLERAGIASSLIFNEERTKANLFASIGPKDRQGVLLSGHSDVVPIAGQAWTSDPFRLVERQGNLYGRGTADMKGFIACVLAVAEQLAPRTLAKPYQMVFSYDEEVGCIGVRRVIEQLPSLATLPELCIVGEPTMMEPVIAHKGKVAGHIKCTGHACHSSQALDGLNAIHLANDMVTSIRKQQDIILNGTIRDDAFTVPVTTLHIGTIKGGTALNIVPSECNLEFEIRNIPSQNADDLLDVLFDQARQLTERASERFPGTGVSIEIFNRYPGLATPADSPALTRVQRLVASNAAGKISFGTEGGLFNQHLGVPVIVCGPGDIAQAHKPDEFVSMAQLDACLVFLERLSSELIAT